MRSRSAWIVVLVLMTAAPRPQAGAQSWNSSRALELVRQATDRRVQQLADSGLLDYRASAHGYLTFLAQLGEGLRAPPRVVKADELALEVYWRAPNLSKQRIVGRRDTTLLPTDIAYHRDHLGIVQNNFPAIIRIGEGDEVRDVPHPLSEEGLREYQFALTDSLRITTTARVIDVYEIQVRPVDDRQPRIAGAVYVERASAQVVRMAFGFTRAAYLDKQLEDVFVVLENGIVGSRFWLPRRQEVEIRRTLTWMDYPVRGIIRGRWEIGEYTLNVETPRGVFVGPEIVVAPREMLRVYPWAPGRIVDSLPAESRLPTPTEIRRVQDEARALVRQQATRRSRAALSARGASDIVRFDRNSGLSLGAGLGARIWRGLNVNARVRYGFGDSSVRGAVDLGWRGERFGVRLFHEEEAREVGDTPERSTLVNTLASQEFGSDYTDAYGVRASGISVSADISGARWSLDAASEEHYRLEVGGRPFRGAFRPSFQAAVDHGGLLALNVDKPVTGGWFGIEWRARARFRASEGLRRADATLETERPVGDVRVVTRTYVAAARVTPTRLVPFQIPTLKVRSQDLVFLGGPVSAPGFQVHELVGDRAFAHHTEVRFPVPFVGANLGRFGRVPAQLQIAPHWSVIALRRVDSDMTILRYAATPSPDPFRLRPSGWYHSAGVSVTTLFDLVRLDFSRELPHRRWRFSVDVTRPFWSIL